MRFLYHKPVLLQEVLAHLQVVPGHKYIDATIGGAGHTLAILDAGGRVLGLDQDPDAIAHCTSLEALQPALASGKLVLCHTNFTHLLETAKKFGWANAAGIILDLGVSSHQLGTPSRGFSFQSTGPLDMRMDTSLPHRAADLVNTLPTQALAHIFRVFAEEPQSLSIAQAIVSARPLVTTSDLASLIPNLPTRRRIFQSLRIAVNDELGALSKVLPDCLSVLQPAGRLAVISFHSLEDRIVKQQFKSWQDHSLGQVLTPNPITPSQSEIKQNPKSTSAKLRVFQKSS